MTMRIVLHGKVPSKKNSKRLMMRGTKRFLVPSKAHEDWHTEQMHILCGGLPHKKPLEAVKHITLTFYPGDRRAGDLSNKAESVMDLLVDAGVLADDSWFVVPELTLHFAGVAKASAGVTIDIFV